ncbi:MAG: glycosyltransferase [Mycoplasmataceae bacterium]|nr:glycosyltransferase [Mycoplasmataceae bacterium]
MKTLGFIIPIYNTKISWIKKCIDSLIFAQLIVNDIEVVIVDNGSKDKEIWFWLQKNYSNYSFVTLKRFEDNYGKKQATLYGINQLQTKFIQVLDSDDWIDSSELKKIIEILNKTQSDLFFLNYNYYDNKKQKLIKVRKVNKARKEYKTFKKVPRFLWHFDTNTILNRTFLIENNFSFPDKIKFYEDMYINMWVLSQARKITYINKAFYNYRINLNGINLSSTSKMIENIGYFYNLIEELIQLNYKNKTTKNNMIHLFTLQYLSVCYFLTVKHSPAEANILINSLLEKIKYDNKYLFLARGMKRPTSTMFGNVLTLRGRNKLIKPINKIVLKIRD